MIEKKNLFIVNSPLQLLNAQEAIYTLKLQNISILVIFNRSINNEKQLEDNLKKIEFGEIIRFYPKKKYKFIGFVKLIKKLKKHQYDKVFTGELDDSNFKILIANLKKNKLFLLDEGTDTISFYETKIKQNELNKYCYKELRYLLAGFKIKLKDTINFFTYYDLLPLDDGEVIKNKLDYIRKDFKQNNKDYSDILFFIGQPTSIFSDKNEVNIIFKSVINKYKDKKILYIPHRGELNIDEEIKSIDENIEILELNQPIEQYFLQNGIYSKHVISCLSTALTTTKMLFENCFVEYIKIKKPNIDLENMRNLDIVYKYFEKSNISEFKINEDIK